MAFSLQARVVFPVDRPPIENGVVTIEGERIVAVSPKAQAGEVADLGDVALLPGFVNCHTHLEFSGLRHPLGSPGMRLVDWIRLVIAERGRGAAEAAGSMAAGLSECARFGMTTIGDIVTSRIDRCVRQSVEDGQDCLSHDEIDVTQFVEVIGFSRARAESALSAACERLDGFAASAHGRIGISPHAPYTVSPDLLNKLIAVAKERALPVAMHLAETEKELELLDRGTGPFRELLEERSMWDAEAISRGSRPLDYLRILVEAPRVLVIHGNYLRSDEQAFLGAHRDRMSLVYCPRTHAYFRHPPYPLAEVLEKNVRVALGTDSRASNPDLDLLAEMRYVARDSTSVDPSDILRMGTLAGAEALGCDAEVGSVTPDKLADLVAIPLKSDDSKSAADCLEAIFASNSSPTMIWSRGKRADPMTGRLTLAE